ncbi:MAG: tripartite tricarboxylate transporter substrate binding protein [Alphaproteobacteria bacterium]|nr:tripartite tricarboxylate transporter substrate binding protein [Alphaproteobacteria bacterium]
MIARVIVGVLLALALAGAAPAQDYPNHTLRMVIGFGPGGATDAVSRIIAQKLGERLGQSVVPDLKLGATGAIAAEVVAKAAPDGHTLILLTGAHPASAALFRSLPFDPLHDFAMVSTVVSYPLVLVTAGASSLGNLESAIARARAAPNAVSYASAGLGSVMHLTGESIASEAGVEWLHVPFKGGAPAMIEVLNGRVDMLSDILTNSYAQIMAGQLRALAVTTRTPSRFLPTVPTVASLLPGIDISSWNGLATTPGTPQPIIDRLNREVRSILSDSDTLQRIAELAGDPMPSTPEAMRARVESEIMMWRAVIERRHIERQ